MKGGHVDVSLPGSVGIQSLLKDRVEAGRQKGHKKNFIAMRIKDCGEGLIFGEDIPMSKLVEYLDFVVVGRARGRYLGVPFLRHWIKET